jgi:hypothetical protein
MKYTGYMVFGRRRKINRRQSRPAPPDQWTWSEEQSHPAIITRAMFDEAQAIAETHRTASDALDQEGRPGHAIGCTAPARAGAVLCLLSGRCVAGERGPGRSPGSHGFAWSAYQDPGITSQAPAGWPDR